MLQEERSIEELVNRALNSKELEALSKGKRLTFDIANISFYPEEERENLAKSLEVYLPGSSRIWSCLKVRGTAKLLRTRRTSPDYRLDLDINTLIPIPGERVEDYEHSNMRPKILSPRSLEVVNIDTAEINVVKNGVLSFRSGIYIRTKGSGGQTWSLQCYRESKEE